VIKKIPEVLPRDLRIKKTAGLYEGTNTFIPIERLSISINI
jgi:hypothetical protein